MFPIKSDELFHGEDEGGALVFEPDCIIDDLLADCNNNHNNNNNSCKKNSSEGRNADTSSNKGSRKRQRKQSSEEVNNKEIIAARNNEPKKVIHRDIERQRRQEMASLYASLRSLLPLEFVKGKRSISDHMHQTVSYIKHLRKKIEDMKTSAETLKKVSGIESSSAGFCKSAIVVMVNPCFVGLEILVTICNDEEAVLFPLSQVFVELIQRGLNVISCTSTRTNEQLLHKIQIEADHLLACIDPSELQEKLFDAINLA